MACGGKHILIVDDDDLIRDLFKMGLERLGYICRSAPDGAEALEVLSSETIDLALVDLIMPDMSGASLFMYIKEKFPDVPVVFITGMNDVKSAVEQLKNGACDYIVKPVTIQQLGQVVEEVLTNRETVLTEDRLLGDSSGRKTVDSIATFTESERIQAHRVATIGGTISIMFY
jgi:DNA-binding NtrC family response regulator